MLSFPFYWKYFTIFTGFFPYFLKERKNHALIVPAALWSSGLRRNPLKVESRVRFPAGSPITHIDIRKDVFCLYVLMVFLREVFFIHEKNDFIYPTLEGRLSYFLSCLNSFIVMPRAIKKAKTSAIIGAYNKATTPVPA